MFIYNNICIYFYKDYKTIFKKFHEIASNHGSVTKFKGHTRPLWSLGPSLFHSAFSVAPRNV